MCNLNSFIARVFVIYFLPFQHWQVPKDNNFAPNISDKSDNLTKHQSLHFCFYMDNNLLRKNSSQEFFAEISKLFALSSPKLRQITFTKQCFKSVFF